MLADKTVFATLAVKNMEEAKKFYEGVLGFSGESKDDGGVMYTCGDAKLFVYESSFAGTNKATAASWTVGDDLESAVTDLKAKGVEFEQYDMPDVEREGDIHLMGNLKAAWFKDPDGNILNLVNEM